MKNSILGIIFLVTFFSCKTEMKLNKQEVSTEEKIEFMNQYLAAGVTVDDQRPGTGILSEQEVLLKAAEVAIERGALNPSYYLYEKDPELLNAKIETPILLHQPDGSPYNYMLTAVDNKETSLMHVYVRTDTNVSNEDFVATIFEPYPGRDDATRVHYITKREVKEYTINKFPGNKVSEPIALIGLAIENSLHSRTKPFWYLKVEGNERSSVSTFDEYLMDATVLGYKPGNNSRAVISNEYGGSPHLGGYRMVKLPTPIHFTYDPSARYIKNQSPNYELKPLHYVGVPLE